RIGLVDFNGDDVGAVDQQVRTDIRRVERRRFVRPGGDGARVGGVSYRARRHVAAEDLDAVQIDNRTVVAQHAQAQAGECSPVGHGKRAAKVRRDKTIRGRAAVDNGGLIAVAKTKLRQAERPSSVVESPRAPGSALIRAIIEVLPFRTGGDEQLLQVDRYSGRGGCGTCVVRGYNRQGV